MPRPKNPRSILSGVIDRLEVERKDPKTTPARRRRIDALLIQAALGLVRIERHIAEKEAPEPQPATPAPAATAPDLENESDPFMRTVTALRKARESRNGGAEAPHKYSKDLLGPSVLPCDTRASTPQPEPATAPAEEPAQPAKEDPPAVQKVDGPKPEPAPVTQPEDSERMPKCPNLTFVHDNVIESLNEEFGAALRGEADAKARIEQASIRGGPASSYADWLLRLQAWAGDDPARGARALGEAIGSGAARWRARMFAEDRPRLDPRPEPPGGYSVNFGAGDPPPPEPAKPCVIYDGFRGHSWADREAAPATPKEFAHSDEGAADLQEFLRGVLSGKVKLDSED